MAVRIMESSNMAKDGSVPIRRAPFTVTQNKLAASGTSQQSDAFSGSTRIVTFQSDEACYILFGLNPTAVTGTGFKVAAGETHDFGVEPGQKVAWVS